VVIAKALASSEVCPALVTAASDVIPPIGPGGSCTVQGGFVKGLTRLTLVVRNLGNWSTRFSKFEQRLIFPFVGFASTLCLH
jgi:hypothetical protein